MKKSCVFIIFAVLLAGTGLFAQDIQTLDLNSTASGDLKNGSEDWYSITPAQTGFLTVETSGDTDTYIEVYDAQRKLLAEDDDGGSGLNAKIEMYAAAGTNYLIKIRGYDRSETGSYILSVNYASVSQAVELSIGTSLRQSLSAGGSLWYSVRTSELGLLVVETSGSTDTFLDAYDSSYNHLISDDDGGEGYNARIEILASAGEVYLLKLRGYDSGETGRFDILASFMPISGDVGNNTERSSAASIRLGEAFPVFLLVQGQSRWYSYEITRPNTHFVLQTRGNMDTLLYIYDTSGNLIAEDDDSGESANALISQRLDAGIYFIQVKAYGSLAGYCTIHAETR